MSTTAGHKGYPYETLAATPEIAGEEIILPSHPLAATPETVDVWKSRHGNYYFREEAARYDGATHSKICPECNTVLCRKGYSLCLSCREQLQQKRYLKLPFEEWEGDTPLALYESDTFFTSDADVESYCEEYEVNAADLQLVICERAYLSEVNYDIWSDELPEDTELPPSILDAVEHLNKMLRSSPVGWLPGKTRTTVLL